MARAKGPDVATFLEALEHPRKADVLVLRQLILASDAAIGEEVKWNAPSFHTTEHFATMNLRDKKGVGVIMHFGAKKRDIKPRASIADPAGLLEWLAEDRAVVSFRDVAEIEAKRGVYTDLIRAWITLV